MNLLSKDDVVAALEHKRPKRVPMHLMHYYNDITVQKYSDGIKTLRIEYPEDVVRGGYVRSDWDSLKNGSRGDEGALDSRIILESYDGIEETCKKIVRLAEKVDMTAAGDTRLDHPNRYCLGYTWFGLYERLWMLRGMENVLVDFYEHPDEIRKLMRAICDYHLHLIRSYGGLGYDGVSISDDLGTQSSTMFGPGIFLDFYKPLYRELFEAAHDFGMHMWMHSCGHVESILDDLIDAGLDVIHPIQHSTYPGGISANDPRRIAERFSGRITFWAGIDVQYLLPRGTVDEVRRGVRELMNIFDGPDGGMVIAAGNGITPETPFENIEAFFDEAYSYGQFKS